MTTSLIKARPVRLRSFATIHGILVLLLGLSAIAALFALARYMATAASEALAASNYVRFGAILVAAIAIAAISYGNFVYLVARHGFSLRRARHAQAPRSDLEKTFDLDPPETIILVPSYKEEEGVIFQTLMSAGLMEYPKRRVVLLIDDPPNSNNKEDAALINAARRLPLDLNTLFRVELEHFQAEHDGFCERRQRGAVSRAGEWARIAQLLERAAQWLEDQARIYRRGRTNAALTHTDRLFIDKILLEQARTHRRRADELRARHPAEALISREYRRLAALFDVQFSSFERKRFANLSHAANKASNLNSYIGLLGGSYREVMHADGLHLEPCASNKATLQVVDAKFIITLDADSLVCSDYALRLIQFLEQPGNERVGLVLTPYAAIRGSASALERAAGAQTDMLYVLQQGYSHFDSAPWGGPNSVIRRQALEDISTEIEERGHRIRTFIQDTTVIEDAGATIDLIRKGWRVTCHPERLCYSATPPDFGSLVIQRERWSNGGLIILSNLFGYLRNQKFSLTVTLEGWFRFYILSGSAMMAVSTTILMLCPFMVGVVPIWLPLIFLPHLVLQVADMIYSKYRLSDLLQVYALSSMLLPIVLGGTLLSLRQLSTGRKESFKRTPKVAGRTAVPIHYLTITYALLAISLINAIYYAVIGRYAFSAMSMILGASYLYGCVRFIGLRETVEDIRAQLLRPRSSLAARRAGARQLGSPAHEWRPLTRLVGAPRLENQARATTRAGAPTEPARSSQSRPRLVKSFAPAPAVELASTEP